MAALDFETWDLSRLGDRRLKLPPPSKRGRGESKDKQNVRPEWLKPFLKVSCLCGTAAGRESGCLPEHIQ